MTNIFVKSIKKECSIINICPSSTKRTKEHINPQFFCLQFYEEIIFYFYLVFEVYASENTVLQGKPKSRKRPGIQSDTRTLPKTV